MIKSIGLRILVILTLAGSLFTACEKGEFCEKFLLRIGEEQKVTSNLSFTIDSLRDSRCPRGAECIWRGKVSLFFNITHCHENLDTLLSCFPGDDVTPFNIFGYKWRILEVNPHPDILYKIDPKDITIKMTLTKD